MSRRLVVAAVVAAVGAATVTPGLAASPWSTHRQPTPVVATLTRTLVDTVPALVHSAENLGPIQPLSSLQVVLPLALPNPAALNRLVTAQYQPGSRAFHRFLTPRSFGARYGATQAEVSRVTSALRALGLHVGVPDPNRLFVTASGPASLLETSFGTTIDRFRFGSHSFFANLSDVRLPAALVGAVTGVIGLDDIDRPHPQLSSGSTAAKPTDSPQLLTLGQDGGATPCPAAIAGAGYTAPQLATAYDFNGLYAKGFLGQGMSAALLEFDDYHDSNVSAMKSCYHLSTPVTRRLVDGGSGGPPAGGEVEVMADITTMLEMLPKLAHLDVYVAPITALGELELYERFVRDDDASVISASWGNCEELASAADNRLYAEITEEAAAQGQQIFDASGDAGAVDCSSLFPMPTGESISVEQEAAVPWVTGVGGTDLGERTANGLPGPRDEATWNDAGASGGGVSTQWRMPAWQYALTSARTAPGHDRAACGAPPGQLCREVPDISADADPDFGMQGTDVQFHDDLGSPGYSFYCATANCALVSSVTGLPLPPLPGVAGWQPVGGTSLSTPLTAAAAVLWDQEAKAAHLDGLGLINPSLYRVAADPASYARDFHDITTGSNDAQYDTSDCPAGCNPHHLYAAAKGYDMATGLGSYDAANLGADLVKQADQITLIPDTVQVYGYEHGVATTAPVVVSAGYRHARYTATSSARWLHVKAGRAPGSLSWSVDPTGLSSGIHRGRIVVDVDGHRSGLSVSYTVTPRARLRLSTSHLYFHEIALNAQGKPTIATCSQPLWDDELFDFVNHSTGTKVSAESKQTLHITNAGPPGSQLHWQALPVTETGSWLSVDLTHGKVATQPQRVLEPTDGTERAGQHGILRLASLANTNTAGGYPAMQQGVYDGSVRIRDLADPRITRIVHATLILGNGHDTPYILSYTKTTNLRVKRGGTTTFTVKLSDGSGACGYAYSVASNRDWVQPSAADFSGTVPPMGSGKAGGSATGSGTGTVRVTVSTAKLRPGSYPFEITVQSQNAEPNPDVMSFTLTVTR